MSALFNQAVSLEDDTPATITELILAAIAARDGVTPQQIADEQSHFKSTPAGHCLIKPDGDILMLAAHRDVHNCVVDQTAWAEADFADAEPLVAGEVKNLTGDRGAGNQVNICSRILYQKSGDAVNVWLDVQID